MGEVAREARTAFSWVREECLHGKHGVEIQCGQPSCCGHTVTWVEATGVAVLGDLPASCHGCLAWLGQAQGLGRAGTPGRPPLLGVGVEAAHRRGPVQPGPLPASWSCLLTLFLRAPCPLSPCSLVFPSLSLSPRSCLHVPSLLPSLLPTPPHPMLPPTCPSRSLQCSSLPRPPHLPPPSIPPCGHNGRPFLLCHLVKTGNWNRGV